MSEVQFALLEQGKMEGSEEEMKRREEKKDTSTQKAPACNGGGERKKIGTKKSVFLTASGFLSAVLLVWAGLWVETAQVYPKDLAGMNSMALGLAYVYWGLLASILAFAMVVFFSLDGRAGKLAALSFYAAMTFTVLEVVASLASVVFKMFWNLPLWEPALPLSNLIPSGLLWSLVVYLVFPLVIFGVWGALVCLWPTKWELKRLLERIDE